MTTPTTRLALPRPGSSDAANLIYWQALVDAIESGAASINDFLSLGYKNPVRVATTANITLSGTQTIDGVAVVVGNRILVKNQTAAAQNGIYLVASGAWTRTTDFDASADAVPGSFVFVSEGSTQSGKWNLTTIAPITLGTTSLTFAQLDLPKSGGQLTGDIDVNGKNLIGNNRLNLANVTGPALTIASGVITASSSYHIVQSEGAAAADDLDTISGGITGDLLILRQVNASQIITIKNGTGNIYTPNGSDVKMGTSANASAVMLFKTSAGWIVLGSAGSGGSSSYNPLTSPMAWIN